MNLSALRLLSAAVLLAVLTTCTAAKPKLVTVNLDAKWPSTPMLLEASEFLAKENNEAFWSFVNSLVDLEPASYTDISDEEMYALLQKLAAPSLTPLQQSLLKFSLSMRSHSPTVQVHQQVALDKVPPGDCEVFIDINNMVTCEMEAFKAFLAVATKQAPPALLKKDHHYPGSQAHPTIVILYANIMRPSFREWHAMLKSLATEGNINYVLRHYNKDPSPQKVRLSGYGVELAIKSTEYKAQDDTKVEDEAGSAADQEDKEDVVKGFVFSKLQDLHPQLKDNLRDFRLHLVDSSSEMAPLKVWQLQDLSFQAAQRVISAPPEDQLRLLSDISQNFPLRARSMIRTVVSEKTRHDVMRNQGTLESKFGIPAGESVLFINGLQADPEIYDVFQLLDTMRSEARLMEGLYNLAGQYDLEGHKLMDLLKIDLREKEANYAIDVRDDAVQYINNMETDKKYSQWPKSVKELLRPTFPGMLRHIAKNLFHMVFIIDPLEKSSKSLIKMAEAFYVHSAPTRIGIVLVVNQDETVDGHTDAGVAILRAFNFIRKTIGSAKALSFLTDIYDRVQEGDITAEFVTTEFLADHAVTSDMVFGSDTEYDDHRVGGAALLARTGLGVLPQVLLNGIPLRREELGEDEFEEAVVGAILKQTQDLQKAVYNGELDDSMDLLDHIMDAPNVMPRLNYRVLTDSDKHLDFSRHLGGGVVGNPASFKALSPADMTGAIASSLKYLTKKDEAMLRPVTIWVVGDLDTAEGRDLVYEAIKNLKNTNVVRLGLIHNPTDIKDNMADSIAMATQVAMETQLTSMSKSFVTKLMKEENVAALASKEKTLEDLSVHGDEDEPPENMDYAGYAAALAAAGGEVLHSHRAFSEQTLGLAPGQRAIICNGKVIGPLNVGERFIQEDFELLEKYTFKSSASKLEPKLKPLALKTDSASELAMRVLGVLTATSQKEPRKEISVVGTHSVIDLPPRDPTQPAYDIVAVLDPTTRAAQKYTPLMMVIQSVVNVRVRVIFNCREKLSEMPLKSFYRYVLEPELRFAVDSSLSSGPIARFQDLPQSSLLTLGMNPPESWLVEAIRAPYDLDNIRLEEADGSVTADFELEHLLLEGHCYDSASGQPPRGLQFILGTSATPAQVDTIVMANLGYFQLKAAPGMWHLKLRSGRSREIYQISSHEYTDSPPDSPDVVVVIDSFTSKIIRVRVHKQAGHEQDDLLGGEEPTPGLWDSFSSQFTGGTKEGQEGEKDETLNIFSLASGHLYERLLRIMMVSVLRHTQSKVKFWFLKNYLSPSFKDFIPSMAKQYNFEYELVQYKWPRWLHQQSEKQRIIWGYKILFLDVLFPLNINKIIFVDADQIVRTDLQELADFDLEGAPYGYTPFCDSRKEMDGFRFWNSGYWQGHLAGRKYHISALYVVDLKKFRKIAAGDRLRGQYQGLSQDPNSLSNLDQDLPNNMIHQVAIKSLPQEWLWCETWCSDSGLKTAKTIDLCNNPLTKEPKLTAAQRIVPEWIEYDTEIKDLWDQKYRRSGTEADNKSSTDSTDKKDEL